ncbi:hypothetical protein BJ912DRAFT_968135 [Pholiota molesta]|nr:hypothetical protein BJ912DRAFT_968135 [Pholiota molesta]
MVPRSNLPSTGQTYQRKRSRLSYHTIVMSTTNQGLQSQLSLTTCSGSSYQRLQRRKAIISDIELETTSRGTSTLPRYTHNGLGSHILFAACGHKGLAYENNGRGRFSTALLKLLREVPHNTLRYSDVLSHPRLDRLPHQDPQCEGLHTGRMLFNAKVLPTKPKCFPITFDGVQYVVHGGTIHNITPDAEFDVYRKDDVTFASPICVLYVDALDVYKFTATLPPNAPQLGPYVPVVAVQTKFGNQVRLRIHIPSGDGFGKIYNDMKKTWKLKHFLDNVALVDISRDPHVKITSPSRDKVKLEMYTKVVAPGQAVSTIRDVTAHPDDLAWILSKMAHFYSEFEHSQVNERISQFVDVAFYELKEHSIPNDDTGFEDTILKPVEPRLNLFAGPVIELPPHNMRDEVKPYGLQLVNRSSLNLHANVFHFNSHDLTISAWAKSHHGRTNRVLEIGFGTAGYDPQIFEITNGLNTEVEFLKIYLSTESVDLSYLEQLSPFDPTRGMGPLIPKPPVIWADIVVPIVLRRHSTATTKHRRN